MKRIFIIVVVVAVAIVSYCLSNVSYEYPTEHEIEFKFIEQPDQITCGPTSVAMVLKCYGHHVTVNQIKDETKTEWFKFNDKEIGMTAPEYIAPAMRKFGVPSKQKTGRLDELKYYVSQNRPSIALLRSGKNLWHYVVVIGYTPSKIILANPSGGRREEMSIENFIGSWSYKTDMRGMKPSSACSTCSGTGRWLDVPGPIGTCVFCDGTGEQDNVLSFLLGVVEAKPYTIIVPNEYILTSKQNK